MQYQQELFLDGMGLWDDSTWKAILFKSIFLNSGHTKFSPDLLFSKIAQSYNRSDVFTTLELKEVISQYAKVVVDNGEIVCDWRSLMPSYLEFAVYMILFLLKTLPLTKSLLRSGKLLCRNIWECLNSCCCWPKCYWKCHS